VRYANVLACADDMLVDFIEYIQAQPYAEDTVIIVSGDHIMMDTEKFYNRPTTERGVFNLFLNLADANSINQSREATKFDLAPTILQALGFEVRRLGLGVGLLGTEPTLVERYGYAHINIELLKRSRLYDSWL
jgi:phosphoglycerol transferase